MTARRREPARRAEFHLHVLPGKGRSYGLELREVDPGDNEANPSAHAQERIWGPPLEGSLDLVFRSIKRAGYGPSDLGPARRAPFRLKEEDGVRLGLLFRALKPLGKAARIDAVVRGIDGMEPEELYYWYSKTSNGATERARRALRILLSEE